VAIVLAYAFLRRGSFGGIVYDPTLDNFRRLADPVFLRVVANSLRLALIATAISLFLAYPAAYAIARLPERRRPVALLLVVLPFWSNFLIRTYAWMVLLNPVGLINSLLTGTGLTSGPLNLLYNEGAVVVGLVYIYLPLMILPVYAAVERLDPALSEAASDLGATPVRTFLTVTLPLTLPGIVAGSIFVFVPSLGNFVIPELLGGGRTVMVGNLIRDQYLRARDWPFGSVLAMCLVALMMLLLLGQALMLRRTRHGGRDG
jgi:spermidine/putrescine transport system permease protein